MVRMKAPAIQEVTEPALPAARYSKQIWPRKSVGRGGLHSTTTERQLHRFFIHLRDRHAALASGRPQGRGLSAVEPKHAHPSVAHR